MQSSKTDLSYVLQPQIQVFQHQMYQMLHTVKVNFVENLITVELNGSTS